MDPRGLPFEVVGFLNEGAAGAVYEVRRPPDDRRLVAKVLKGTSPNARERLRREGELVARLDAHPGIVRVVAAGQLQDGNPYLLFELIEGRPLRDLMRLGPLAPSRAVSIAIEVADALAWAHARGVVHRDVKPENVLVAEDRVRLADFGLALAADLERITATRQMVGTPLYLAPEQVPGGPHEIGPATDVHALGLLLYEALAGAPLFDGSDPERLLRSIQSRLPRPLAGRLPGVEPAHDALLARCLAKDPRQRYPSAAELLADLRRLAEGKALSPLPTARRRALGPVALAAGLSLALALGATLRAAVVRPDRAGQEAIAAVALLEQAGAALREGDLERARACLAAIATGRAPGAELEVLRAGVLALDPAGSDRLGTAAQALERALVAEPRRPELREWLARLELRRDRPQAAATALVGHPDPPPALALEVALAAGRLEGAEALLLRVQDPVLRAELAWARAAQRLEQGDLAGARPLLEEAVRWAPASRRRGPVLERLRARVEEVSAWTPSPRGGPEDLERLRSEVAWRSALLLLEPGHRLPEERQAPLSRVAQALAQHDKGRAREPCTALLALAPEHDGFYFAYGAMALGDGYSRPAEDVARLQRALQLAGARGLRGLVAVGLAGALAAAGRTGEIAALADELQGEDPRGADWVRAVLARALSERGEHQAGLALAEELVERDPQGAGNHYTRHLALRGLGDPGGATEAAWSYLRGQNAMGSRFPGELERAAASVAWIASQAAPAQREEVRIRALGEVLRARPDAVHLVAAELRDHASPALVDLLERALQGWRRSLARPVEEQRLGREQLAQFEAALDSHLAHTVPRARELVAAGARQELAALLEPLLQRGEE